VYIIPWDPVARLPFSFKLPAASKTPQYLRTPKTPVLIIGYMDFKWV